MNLNWSAGEYEMMLKSPREHQLVRDTIVEGAYIVEGLPDVECVARLGRTKAEVQVFIDGWREFRSPRNLPVLDLELIKSCFSETLSFFSDAEYQLRTGWTKEEAGGVFSDLLEDRKRITINRQWG
jgi:hypothetical protein